MKAAFIVLLALVVAVGCGGTEEEYNEMMLTRKAAERADQNRLDDKITAIEIEEAMRGGPKTKRLTFSSTFKGTGFEELVPKIPQLEFLFFNGSKITDGTLKEVSKLRNLNSLILSDCHKITDAGLKDIAKLDKLTALDLRETFITNKGIKELVALPYLTSLDLQKCGNINYECLNDLAKMKHLTYLNLHGSGVVHWNSQKLIWQYSPEAGELLKQFEKTLPNCKIQF